MKKNKWKYLDTYVEDFKKNNGMSKSSCQLPDLVIYFRIALHELGILDIDVPEFFKWRKYVTNDFLSWGHNSRWAHTFCYELLDHTDKHVRILKKEMENYEIDDFDLTKKLGR